MIGGSWCTGGCGKFPLLAGFLRGEVFAEGEHRSAGGEEKQRGDEQHDQCHDRRLVGPGEHLVHQLILPEQGVQLAQDGKLVDVADFHLAEGNVHDQPIDNTDDYEALMQQTEQRAEGAPGEHGEELRDQKQGQQRAQPLHLLHRAQGK